MMEITLEDLEATSAALEGFLDAFDDGEESMKDQCERVRKVMERMDGLIAEMRGPSKPVLRLVKKEDGE